MDIANYLAEETLPNANRIVIRALRPEDRDEFVAAASRASDQSMYRRLFAARRHFTDTEISYFVNVDFKRHVALVATGEQNGKPVIMAGARYFAETAQQAEVAFMVIDDYQGQGIGGLLLRHLIGIARASGLQELVAQVLPANGAMLKVFQRCGLPISSKRDSGVVNVTLQLN